MSRKYYNSYFIDFLIRHHDFCQKITEGILEEYKAYKNQKIAIIGASFCFQLTRTACAEVYQSGDKISGVYKIKVGQCWRLDSVSEEARWLC